MTRSIAIVSLENGSGKTTVALNLGLALSKMNYKVLVFDSDFTKNNMLEHLEVHNMPIHIDHVLNGEAHINDAVYNHVSGLKLILSVTHNPDAFGYEKFSYNFQDLLGTYDYIILDTPIQISHLQEVLKSVDEALIVHNPEYSSKNVHDAIELLSRFKILNLGIILNKASENSGNVIFDYPILEIIPKHKDITKSYKHKNPLLHTHPKSKIASKFHRLAKRLG